MQENIPWIEKYRPLHFDDIVLDPLNKTLFKNILDNRYFPNLLLYGPPGTGKTTTIINLINEYNGLSSTSGKNKESVIHLNASDERGIDIIRHQINQFVKSKHLFETGMKFVILDEVDYMTKNAQQALKSLLQTCRPNVRFCLICNYICKIDESLKHEFCCIRFNQLPVKDIYAFIRHITRSEGIILSQDEIETIQINYQSDIRSMINFIQLNATTFTNIDDSTTKPSENDGESPSSVANMCLHSKIVRNENWRILHGLLAHHTVAENNIENYIQHISMHFNIDKRNILNMYFNFVLRTYPEIVSEEWLSIAENVIHTTDDVEIKHVLQYFCVNLREYYIGKMGA